MSNATFRTKKFVMKTITLLLLLLLPCLGVAQSDSLVPQQSVVPLPPGQSLKPIEFREIPYQYTTSSTSTYGGRRHTSYNTHTGIQRIYTYDGIDVVDPETTLWPTLLAVNDPDVARLRQELNTIRENRATAMTMGTVLMVPGLIMMGVGLAQNKEYRNLVAQQRPSYYTVMQPTTTYTTKTCGGWTGVTNKQGTIDWTCSTDFSIKYTGTDPPFSIQIPVTTTIPVTHTSAPAPVTVSDGKGLMIAGLASTLVGLIVFSSSRGDGPGTFLRAVQYYNRALKQPVSWQLLPYSSFGTAGPSVVVRF